MGVYFASGFTCLQVSHQYVFENGLFQLSGGTSCDVINVKNSCEILRYFFQILATPLKRLRQRCLSVNFATFLRTSFDDCFLCLRSFPDHLFYRAPLGNCLFHLQVAEFQPPHTVKKYFIGAFQVFYTRRRSSCSNAFMYLKSLKIICEEVDL